MRQLSASYPMWLCDIWGVVHDGVSHFPAAVDALSRHRSDGGTVILVTNAPRTAPAVEHQLGRLGVPRDSYDAVVTSGEVTRRLIAGYRGSKAFHLGPPRDLTVYDGLGVELGSLDEAAVAVCIGLFDDRTETPDDYAGLLSELRRRGLDMICANPDKRVRKGERLLYCAGALAERYEQLGGRVLMAGKPFTPIYDLALAQGGRIAGRIFAKRDVLVIGDGPETDVRGAADYGLDIVLIAGGVMDKGLPPEAAQHQVERAMPEARIVKTLSALRW